MTETHPAAAVGAGVAAGSTGLPPRPGARPSRRAAEPHPAFSPSYFKRFWIQPNTQQATLPISLSAHHVQKARWRELLEKKKNTIL